MPSSDCQTALDLYKYEIIFVLDFSEADNVQIYYIKNDIGKVLLYYILNLIFLLLFGFLFCNNLTSRSSVELEVELRQATKSRSIFDKQVATLRSK